MLPAMLLVLVLHGHLPDDTMREIGLPLAANLIGIIFFGLFLTWLVSSSYQTPLVAMKRAVLDIRAGNYEARTPVRSADEIGFLGEALNEMSTALAERELILETFGRAVDPAVRDHLLSGNIRLGGELRDAVVLFTDIRNFTTISEKSEPDEVVRLLNRHFASVGSCIEAEQGLINKFIGDAVMAVFGVPLPQGNSAERAVRAALAMLRAREALNEQLVREGFGAIRTGIGIHSGRVLAGNIGSANRMEYTVIGDTVNTAARIEGLCKELSCDLIITDAVRAQLGPDFQTDFLARRSVRGKSQELDLYSVRA